MDTVVSTDFQITRGEMYATARRCHFWGLVTGLGMHPSLQVGHTVTDLSPL